ncbi:MAG: PAS domain S-box protein [Methanomicrobiales archaeon]
MVAVYLALFLIVTDLIFGLSVDILTNDIFRSVIFTFVSMVVILLSESIEKSKVIIEKSEKKFKSVVQTAVEAIITLSYDGNIVSWNKGAEKIFGYKEEEVTGKHITVIMPKRYRQRFKESFSRFSPSDASQEYLSKMKDMNALRKDGSEFPFDISIVNWKAGGELFFTAIIRDISERKKFESALKNSKKRFETIFEYAPDAYYLNDSKGHFIDGNRAAEELVGYKKEDLLGKNFQEAGILPLSQVPKALKLLAKSAAGLSTGPDEIILKTKSGTKIDVEIRTIPIKLDEKRVVLGIARNITQRKKAEEIQARLAAIVEYSDDAIIGEDLEGTIISWNKGAENIYGYSKSEMIGRNHSFLIPSEKSEEKETILKKIRKGKVVEHYETIRYRKDGKKIYVSLTVSPIKDTDGRLIGNSIIARDITNIKKDEIALKESEEKFREVSNNANDPIVLLELQENGLPGHFLEVNEVTLDGLGYSKEELMKMSASDVIASEKTEDLLEVAQELSKYGQATFETLALTKNGNKIPVEINTHTFLLKDEKVILAIIRDISERKLAEEQIKKSLAEKEMLLKEIHHRVKNNLMVISSLLSLQSRYIKDKAALDIFRESQNRAKSMALIHERLYRSTDLKRIDFGEYIRSLTTELYHTYVPDPSLIKLNVNVEDLMLDINTAIPLGLIVNELVSNSMKHAFPKGKAGEITIELYSKHSEYTLSVSDNGIGFPEDLDYKNTSSLGLQLVNSLTDQIGGTIELDRVQGTNFKIKFAEEKFD